MNRNVYLHTPEIIKNWQRNLVLRCKVGGDSKIELTSVIIKQIKDNKTCGYSDWASLYFLSLFTSIYHIVPEIYCGDIKNSFFIIEDLGAANTIEDILKGTEASLVEPYFIDLVSKTAKLHFMTVEKESDFQKIRGSFPIDTEYGRFYEGRKWIEGMNKVYKWFNELDCTIPNGFDKCLIDINNIYLYPGVFLTFTHGDMAPSNNHIVDDQVYLLDFEYGDFRHALYDITCWYMLCPLPEMLVKKIKEHYKKEFCKNINVTEETFELNWDYMCIWRGLALLSWIPYDVLNENRIWVGDWTMREAVLSTLKRLYQVCQHTKTMSPLAEGVTNLQQKLINLWPEYKNVEVIPKWPVFQ